MSSGTIWRRKGSFFMLEFLQTGKALSVLAAIGIIGIVSKLITRSLYKRLLKETDNMAMTKNKNLKVLKQKLENAYRLNQNIVNTQAYLDKHLYGFRFMHVSLDSWNNLSLQMTILSFWREDLVPLCLIGTGWIPIILSCMLRLVRSAACSSLLWTAALTSPRNSRSWKPYYWNMWIIQYLSELPERIPRGKRRDRPVRLRE